MAPKENSVAQAAEGPAGDVGGVAGLPVDASDGGGHSAAPGVVPAEGGAGDGAQ